MRRGERAEGGCGHHGTVGSKLKEYDSRVRTFISDHRQLFVFVSAAIALIVSAYDQSLIDHSSAAVPKNMLGSARASAPGTACVNPPPPPTHTCTLTTLPRAIVPPAYWRRRAQGVTTISHRALLPSAPPTRNPTRPSLKTSTPWYAAGHGKQRHRNSSCSRCRCRNRRRANTIATNQATNTSRHDYFTSRCRASLIRSGFSSKRLHSAPACARPLREAACRTRSAWPSLITRLASWRTTMFSGSVCTRPRVRP